MDKTKPKNEIFTGDEFLVIVEDQKVKHILDLKKLRELINDDKT